MNKKPNSIPSAGTKADSEQNDENLFVSQHSSKPHVVRSPNVVSTEKTVEEFEESKKKGYGRFVFDKEGKVSGVEMVTLPDTNNVFIPTDDKV
jgi:hypothetical protein